MEKGCAFTQAQRSNECKSDRSTHQAGYYSYLWAEVLDKDAFEAFREKGIFNRETAKAFRKNILEKGGSDDPMKLYIMFRGKEPSIKPLLRSRGLL